MTLVSTVTLGGLPRFREADTTRCPQPDTESTAIFGSERASRLRGVSGDDLDQDGIRRLVHSALGALGRSDADELARRTGLSQAALFETLTKLAADGEAVPLDDGRWQIGVTERPTSTHWVSEFRRQLAEEPGSLDELPGIQTFVGADATLEAHYELLQRTESSMLLLERPPYLGGLPSSDEEEPENPETAAARRGIDVRIVYSPGFRHLTRLRYVRFAVQMGYPIRIGPVPIKLTIIDDRLAFIPILRSYDVPHHVTSVIVHEPAMVQSLRELFESTWEFARPVPIAFASESAERRSELIAMLLAGVTDATIARELDVTERTVRRWVRDLLTITGCETRLQLGAALAAQRDSQDPLNPID